MTKFRRFFPATSPWHILIVILILPIALIFNIIVVALLLLNPRTWRFNKAEALAILEREMAPFAKFTYDDCKKYVEAEPVLTTTVVGESGTEYQIEVEMIWDRCPDGPIRVFGSIDDGLLRAYKPVSKSIVILKDSVPL